MTARDWRPAAPAMLAMLVVAGAALGPALLFVSTPLLVDTDLPMMGQGMQLLHDGWVSTFSQRDLTYRPLGMLLHGWMGQMAGTWPVPQRLLLALLHGTNALLVWAFARRWLGPRAALWGGLLFAVTYVKYENVLWLWGLHNVAAATLLGLALIGLWRGWGWLAWTLYATSVLLYAPWMPLLCVVALALDRARGRPLRPGLYAALATVPVAWFLAMHSAWGWGDPLPMLLAAPWTAPGVWAERVARNLVSFFAYPFFPFDLLDGAGRVLKFLVGAGVMLGLVRGLRSGATGVRIFSGFALASAAASSVRTLVEARYLYVVSAGLFPLAAAGVLRLVEGRRPAVRWATGILAACLMTWHAALLVRWGLWIREAAHIQVPVLADLAAAARAAPRDAVIIAEGLPLWGDRARLPVPLFAHTLAPTVWAVSRRLDVQAYYDRETISAEAARRAIRLRYTGGRLVPVASR